MGRQLLLRRLLGERQTLKALAVKAWRAFAEHVITLRGRFEAAQARHLLNRLWRWRGYAVDARHVRESAVAITAHRIRRLQAETLFVWRQTALASHHWRFAARKAVVARLRGYSRNRRHLRAKLIEFRVTVVDRGLLRRVVSEWSNHLQVAAQLHHAILAERKRQVSLAAWVRHRQNRRARVALNTWRGAATVAL
jgi:hypothetical protein